MRAHSVYAYLGFVVVPRWKYIHMDVARFFMPIRKTWCSMKKLNFFREAINILHDPEYRKLILRDIAIIMVISIVLGIIVYLCIVVYLQQDYIDWINEHIRELGSKYQ